MACCGCAGKVKGDGPPPEDPPGGRTCVGHRVLKESQAKCLADKDPERGPCLGWWNTPQPPLHLLEESRRQLADLPMPRGFPAEVRDGMCFSTGSGAEVARLMLQVTKARSTYEAVPEPLRGVFWMKGNAMTEVLAVIHGGTWFEEERILIAPQTPFSWAWPMAVPKKPPMGGAIYKGIPRVVFGHMLYFLREPMALSFRFGRCPRGERYGDPHATDPLAYAYMQSHHMGNLLACDDMGKLVPSIFKRLQGIPFSGRFTMQAVSSDGSHWKRTCDWGLCGRTVKEFGTYDLVKVLDGNGQPVQPHYDDFLDFIGDVPLAVWSGWPSQSAHDLWQRGLTDKGLRCGRADARGVDPVEFPTSWADHMPRLDQSAPSKPTAEEEVVAV